jgi:hypothetical protein
MRKPIFLVALILGVVTYTNLGGSGCGGGTTPASSSSGAFGVVTVGGKQKLYLPLQGQNSIGNGQIAVVDVGPAGAGVNGVAALITDIDLGSTDVATCTAGTDTVVVAASTTSYKVWFIDPVTDKIITSLSLDSSLGASSFSGGGGIVNGIAIDTAHNQAILSIWDGFAYVDLTAHSFKGQTLTASAENFGLDTSREMVLAPFYDCAAAMDDAGNPPAICTTYMAGDAGVMIAGLNVIRLFADAGVAYTYENLAATDPTNPLGTKPDSAAVDVNTGLAVLPDEGTGTQYILDMSKAVFDDQAFTFSAPVSTKVAFSYSHLTGVAIESSTHLALWEEEGSDGIAVVNLSNAYSGSAMPVVGRVPSLPAAGGSWSNLLDPHGVAVATGIQSGNPVGFVVSDGSAFAGGGVWVARIDLQKVLSLGAATADGGVPDLTPAITFLNASTKE